MQVALLAGEIDFTFDTLAVVPQVEAGRLRALAVTENERWRDLPDVPTVYELGLAKAGMSLWIGLLAPANTPQPILARLHQAMIEAGKDADARKRLEFYGRVEFKSPTDFQSQIMQELSQNEIIVREANIKIE